MDEQDLEEMKASIRLYALENIVTQLWATVLKVLPPGSFEEMSTSLQTNLQGVTFPGLDAAMSDLHAAELQAAVERLLGMMRSHLEKGST
jgi:hypothetical protein